MATQKPCIFCDIIAGKSPNTVIEFENENIVIFKDIKPASDFHYLAVPKKHIEDVRTLTLADKDLVLEMQNQLTELFQKHGIDLADVSYGFHWPPFVSVKHLHMHGIAPVSKMRFFGRIVFKPINIWYCTADYLCSRLK